jgi:hypothetical protein
MDSQIYLKRINDDNNLKTEGLTDASYPYASLRSPSIT